MNSLFVYGTLKQGEIAYSQIQDYVKEVCSAELPGYEIGIRDGLPVIFEKKNSLVYGDLITVNKNLESQFEKVLNNYESTTLYRKIQVMVNVDNRAITCDTYLARKERGRSFISLPNSSWSSLSYPHFAYSFPILFESIQKINNSFYPADMHVEYWKYMNELQEKYLLLVSILENIALLVFGPSDDSGPNKRVTQLGLSNEWREANNIVKRNGRLVELKVKDAKSLADKYSNMSADRAILLYYQIRNNLSHQGKSGYDDCELIFNSLQSLSEIIKEYLSIKVVGIREVWLRSGIKIS